MYHKRPGGGVSHLESYREHPANNSVGEAGANVRHHPVEVGRVAHARIQQRGNTALRVSVCKIATNEQQKNILQNSINSDIETKLLGGWRH
jgi:hypothetical protein